MPTTAYSLAHGRRSHPPVWEQSHFAFVAELATDRVQRDFPALATLLWNARGAVAVWTATETRGRDRLFARRRGNDGLSLLIAEGRTEAPDLGRWLDVFAGLVNRPLAPSTADVSAMCEAFARWCESQGLTESTIQFAEAAAFASSKEPRLANFAARAARVGGHGARAELWYEHAIRLARARQNVLEYINANLGWGALLLERCDFQSALLRIRRAGSIAHHRGMREQGAEAFHDALAVTIVSGDYSRGIHYARRAYQIYPKHAKRYPAFAFDFAYLLVCYGLYAEALPLFRGALQRLSSPSEQLVIWSAMARAAAGAGQELLFEKGREAAEELAAVHREAAAPAYYHLGEGARSLGRWELAVEYGTRACTAALEANSEQVTRLASQLKQSVSRREDGVPALPSDDGRLMTLKDLADKVLWRLERWRGPTWRPRQRLNAPIRA